MSVIVMQKVWELDLPRIEKLVLLAYADHADHEGSSVFPSIARIASKAGCTPRTAQRITRKLESRGLLIPMGGQRGGRGVTAHWRIVIPAQVPPQAKGDSLAPPGNGDNLEKRVTDRAQKGDTAVSSESSLTVIKPSAGRLLEKPKAEPAEQIKVWTEVSQDPALKPSIRVEAIQSLLGARLNIHAATRRWKELAAFVDARQQEQGQMLDTFLQWLTSRRDFDLRYWPPGRMLEMWPQAFPNPIPAQRERQWRYVNGELVEVME